MTKRFEKVYANGKATPQLKTTHLVSLSNGKRQI
jgi:hypothetical protein